MELYPINDFEEHCVSLVFVRQQTVIGTPQQNRVAELMNGTLMDRTQIMLSVADLKKVFGLRLLTRLVIW